MVSNLFQLNPLLRPLKRYVKRIKKPELSQYTKSIWRDVIREPTTNWIRNSAHLDGDIVKKDLSWVWTNNPIEVLFIAAPNIESYHLSKITVKDAPIRPRVDQCYRLR